MQMTVPPPPGDPGTFYRLSGPVRVEHAGRGVDVRPPALAGLLAVLQLEAGRFLSRDELLDALWDDPPPSAVTNLRGHVHQLRRLLAGLDPALAAALRTLKGRRGGYALVIPEVQSDVAVLARLAEAGHEHFRNGCIERAADSLKAALGLWRGPVGQGCAASASLEARFAAVNALHLSVRERLAQVQLIAGRTSELLPGLKELVGAAPHRERSWSLLMQASYLGGDIAGAIDAWRRATSTFADEFGLEPSAEFNALYVAMLRRDDDRVRELGRR